jgi:hypothetical protein
MDEEVKKKKGAKKANKEAGKEKPTTPATKEKKRPASAKKVSKEGKDAGSKPNPKSTKKVKKEKEGAAKRLKEKDVKTKDAGTTPSKGAKVLKKLVPKVAKKKEISNKYEISEEMVDQKSNDVSPPHDHDVEDDGIDHHVPLPDNDSSNEYQQPSNETQVGDAEHPGDTNSSENSSASQSPSSVSQEQLIKTSPSLSSPRDIRVRLMKLLEECQGDVSLLLELQKEMDEFLKNKGVAPEESNKNQDSKNIEVNGTIKEEKLATVSSPSSTEMEQTTINATKIEQMSNMPVNGTSQAYSTTITAQPQHDLPSSTQRPRALSGTGISGAGLSISLEVSGSGTSTTPISTPSTPHNHSTGSLPTLPSLSMSAPTPGTPTGATIGVDSIEMIRNLNPQEKAALRAKALQRIKNIKERMTTPP